jgi:GDP-4-dehydro-6-deoxy-D-mannose reductase
MAGSYLAEHLLAQGDEVTGCSRRGEWPGYVPEFAQRIPLQIWDAATPPSNELCEFVSRFAPDWIFHLAALSVPADCGWPEPTPLATSVNVGGTEALLRLAASLPHAPRVVLASSCHVYGSPPEGEAVVSEAAPPRPLGGYGKTKLAAEQALLRQVVNGRIDGVVGRVFHHTGPRQLPRMMVPQWARQLAMATSEPLRVQTLDSWLDLCDVRDVVRAYRLLAERGASGETYNVGNGQAVRSGDVLRLMCRLCGSQREVIETSPGRRQNPIADVSRMQAQSGWRAELPLEQTLQDTLDFWRSRPFG